MSTRTIASSVLPPQQNGAEFLMHLDPGGTCPMHAPRLMYWPSYVAGWKGCVTWTRPCRRTDCSPERFASETGAVPPLLAHAAGMDCENH